MSDRHFLVRLGMWQRFLDLRKHREELRTQSHGDLIRLAPSGLITIVDYLHSTKKFEVEVFEDFAAGT